ncbi:major histocompatibility complex class I-related gene protein-like [Centroberyx affinis]|uniref:major histocompatibility complex class I-related gene protein-like n=1 Tax=Centroberyx affinis TaxID=166261 RepID=UPI003A5B9DB6
MHMQWIVLFIRSFLVSLAEYDSHSLEFLSIGLTEPGDQPSIEQLTVFDRVTISYCSSVTEEEEPKHSLESKNLFKNCKSAHGDILEFLHVIPAFINSTLYVVQRRRGCIQLANGTVSAFDAWAVNGKDFLNFDPHSLKWMSQSPTAAPLEHSWNNREARNHAFSHFIKTQCPLMLMGVKLRSINQHTDVRILAKPIPNTAKVSLRCHVTSTDKSVRAVHLIGEGAARVTVTGPLPSGDGSVILRLTAEISSQNMTKYGCKVQTSSHNITVLWDGDTHDGRHQWQILMIILCLLAIIIVLFGLINLLLKCGKQKSHRPPSVDPQEVQQFARFMESEGSAEIRMVVIAHVFGVNIPQKYQEAQINWEEMTTLRERIYYDTEFHGAAFHGV